MTKTRKFIILIRDVARKHVIRIKKTSQICSKNNCGQTQNTKHENDLSETSQERLTSSTVQYYKKIHYTFSNHDARINTLLLYVFVGNFFR